VVEADALYRAVVEQHGEPTSRSFSGETGGATFGAAAPGRPEVSYSANAKDGRITSVWIEGRLSHIAVGRLAVPIESVMDQLSLTDAELNWTFAKGQVTGGRFSLDVWNNAHPFFHRFSGELGSAEVHKEK
jgi:hypothetical protein